MTKKPSKHQRTQAPGNEISASADADLLSAARQRLEHERRAAIDRLRQLGGSFEGDDDVAPAGLAAGRDEGDQALASEQTDMALMTRERLAERIERLTAALERASQGQYGTIHSHSTLSGATTEASVTAPARRVGSASRTRTAARSVTDAIHQRR